MRESDRDTSQEQSFAQKNRPEVFKNERLTTGEKAVIGVTALGVGAFLFAKLVEEMEGHMP